MKAIYALILIMCASDILQAQPQNLQIDRKVKGTNGQFIEGTPILLTDSLHNTIYQTQASRKGRFEVKVGYDNLLNIKIRGIGYEPKYLSVDTRNLSIDQRNWGYEFGGFFVYLDEGASNAEPVWAGSIVYDPEIEKLYFD